MKASDIKPLLPSEVPFSMENSNVKAISYNYGFDRSIYPNRYHLNRCLSYGGAATFKTMIGYKDKIRRDVIREINGYNRNAIFREENGREIVSLLHNNWGVEVNFGTARLPLHSGKGDWSGTGDNALAEQQLKKFAQWRRLVYADWFDGTPIGDRSVYSDVKTQYTAFDLADTQNVQWYVCVGDSRYTPNIFFVKDIDQEYQPAYEGPNTSSTRLGTIKDNIFTHIDENFRPSEMHVTKYEFLESPSAFVTEEFDINDSVMLNPRDVGYENADPVTNFVTNAKRNTDYDVPMASVEEFIVPSQYITGYYAGKNYGYDFVDSIPSVKLYYWASYYDGNKSFVIGTRRDMNGCTEQPIFLKKGKYRVLRRYGGPIMRTSYTTPPIVRIVLRRIKMRYRNAMGPWRWSFMRGDTSYSIG